MSPLLTAGLFVFQLCFDGIANAGQHILGDVTAITEDYALLLQVSSEIVGFFSQHNSPLLLKFKADDGYIFPEYFIPLITIYGLNSILFHGEETSCISSRCFEDGFYFRNKCVRVDGFGNKVGDANLVSFISP